MENMCGLKHRDGREVHRHLVRLSQAQQGQLHLPQSRVSTADQRKDEFKTLSHDP